LLKGGRGDYSVLTKRGNQFILNENIFIIYITSYEQRAFQNDFQGEEAPFEPSQASHLPGTFECRDSLEPSGIIPVVAQGKEEDRAHFHLSIS
jgi:hypothetical protein